MSLCEILQNQNELNVTSPDQVVALHIRVPVDVVGVDVVLHDVLVDPRGGRTADVVLGQPQEPVDERIAADGTVVGVVLNVQAWKGAGNILNYDLTAL
jgi:hypothetical protein